MLNGSPGQVEGRPSPLVLGPLQVWGKSRSGTLLRLSLLYTVAEYHAVQKYSRGKPPPLL